MKLTSNRTVILGNRSRLPNTEETNLTVGESAGHRFGPPAPISLKGNGVVRVTGSYVYRDRIDTPGDTLVADIMAWDLRNASFDPDGDGAGNDFPELLFAPPVAACNFLFDGTSYTRQTSAGAVSIIADPVTGVIITTPPGNWTEISNPAANVLATITHAAGAGGEVHVCTGITATLAAGATASAIVNVFLRDGLTTAGTILWTGVMAVLAGDSKDISLSGLSIPGTADTAMTLEFSGAGGATTVENVTLTGYTAL